MNEAERILNDAYGMENHGGPHEAEYVEWLDSLSS
jgi:hypothetical protein